MVRESKEIADDIAADLPSYYPNSPGTGNYKLIRPIAEYIAETSKDVDDVEQAIDIRDVTDFDALENLGALVGVTPYENEDIEHLRARILAEYALTTCEGTIEDVLVNAARILNIRPEAITYTESLNGEAGAIELTFPKRALDNNALSNTEFGSIVDRLLPVSYRIDTFIPGSFEYITPSDYNSNNHDATIGYDGLDSNGEPKDNGGTYAGVL